MGGVSCSIGQPPPVRGGKNIFVTGATGFLRLASGVKLLGENSMSQIISPPERGRGVCRNTGPENMEHHHQRAMTNNSSPLGISRNLAVNRCPPLNSTDVVAGKLTGQTVENRSRHGVAAINHASKLRMSPQPRGL